jgi:hypothetical protein
MHESSVEDPDPHNFRKLDPDPHQSRKLDPDLDPHQNKKQDPNQHVGSLRGSFWSWSKSWKK